MTEKQIIEKATKALIALGFRKPGKYEAVVMHVTDALLLEWDEELKTTYSVSFPYHLGDGRMSSTSVIVDSKSNKLIRIVDRHGGVEIPEELQ